jgi:transposase-like protein
LASELRRHALIGVKAVLETALLEELEVHRQPYRQQSLPTQLQRSGTYTRRVLTTHGFIPDLHIPKLRGGNGERTWQVLRRYQLGMPLLLDHARHALIRSTNLLERFFREFRTKADEIVAFPTS